MPATGAHREARAAIVIAKPACVPCADYLTKVVVSGKSSATLSVEEIMTPESVLKTVTPATRSSPPWSS